MQVPIVFAAVVLAVNALTAHEQWNAFKVKHGKVYKNIVEDKLRSEIFQSNLKKIEEHNAKYEAGLKSYWMGVNKFADLTSKEFGTLLKRQNGMRPKINGTFHVLNASAPESIDWRERNAVLAVKNQGECGSCWAFSATGSMEGQNAIINNKRIPLSEQQLLDCSGSYGNGDCVYGGVTDYAFQYVIHNGIASETDYPYTAKQGRCKEQAPSVLRVKKYKLVHSSEKALQNAVGTVGPVSITIYGDPIQLYEGGIFDDEECVSNPWNLDHAVLAVAYGSENGKKFWTIKNSWGSDWGEDGFFRLDRGSDRCGLSLEASYPIL